MRLLILSILTGTFLILTIASYDLGLTCSPSKAYGGTGTCGPSFCANAGVASTLPGCIFTSTVVDYQAYVSTNAKCKTCTQSTDSRCTKTALSAVIKGTGIVHFFLY